MSAQAILEAGIAALCGRRPEASAVARLERFLDLLEHWGRSYNLTAVRRREDMVIRHLLDSLSVEPYLRGPRVLDVGSGAGLPGVPLAILRGELSFVLLDSSAKRVRFLREVRRVLRLDNVELVQMRLQHYAPTAVFDTVLTRAFSSLREFVDNAGRLAASTGCLIAMKGRHYDHENLELPAGFRLQRVQSVQVPGLAARRALILVEPCAPGRGR